MATKTIANAKTQDTAAVARQQAALPMTDAQFEAELARRGLKVAKPKGDPTATQAMQQAMLLDVQAVVKKAVGDKIVVTAGYAHEGANQNYGDIAFEFSFNPKLDEEIEKAIGKTLTANKFGFTEKIKRIGRQTVQFGRLDSGKKPVPRMVHEWNEWAGHVPANDEDYDFSMLEKSWLGASFLEAWTDPETKETKQLWHRVIGLSPKADEPVMYNCDDKWNLEYPGNGTAVFRTTAAKLAEFVRFTYDRKLSADEQKRRPDDAKIVKPGPAPKSGPVKKGNGAPATKPIAKVAGAKSAENPAA
jgi:hypothetical protein